MITPMMTGDTIKKMDCHMLERELRILLSSGAPSLTSMS